MDVLLIVGAPLGVFGVCKMKISKPVVFTVTMAIRNLIPPLAGGVVSSVMGRPVVSIGPQPPKINVFLVPLASVTIPFIHGLGDPPGGWTSSWWAPAFTVK